MKPSGKFSHGLDAFLCVVNHVCLLPEACRWVTQNWLGRDIRLASLLCSILLVCLLLLMVSLGVAIWTLCIVVVTISQLLVGVCIYTLWEPWLICDFCLAHRYCLKCCRGGEFVTTFILRLLVGRQSISFCFLCRIFVTRVILFLQ